MNFFESEVVRDEMIEIRDLQDRVYHNIFKFPSMTKKERLLHIDVLEKLIEKQKILYTRLSLSDDSDAIEMKKKILESAKLMGLPSNVDMNIVFNNMTKTLEMMKNQIDKNDP